MLDARADGSRRNADGPWQGRGALTLDSRKIRPISDNRRVVVLRQMWQAIGVKTILTPVDFSGISDSVSEQATSLAKAFDGRVVLLHAVQPPVITSEYGAFMDNISEIVLVGEKAVAKQLARLEAQLAEQGVEVETLQLTGAPVPTILEQAGKLAADFIVMGSHGHTAFYDLLMGSTTHGVLLRSPCPVVIVPAQKKTEVKPKLELQFG